MVVVVKVGRRIHRNNDKKWFLRQVANLKNSVSIQNYIWSNITYGFKLATIKMNQTKKKNKHNPSYIFDYVKKTYTEEENLNYNIEWLELRMTGTYEEELEEYNQSLLFFSKMQDNPVFKQRMDKVEVDPELSAEYSKKIKSNKAKEAIAKGLDRVKDITMSKSLNDVGILVMVTPPEKPEELKDQDKSEVPVENGK